MRPTRLILSVLALLALAAAVVGLPLLLILTVGWPFPDPWPSWVELGDMLAGRLPVPADLVISVLALVMWLLWFQVAWAVVVEVTATFRGRLATRAPILPGLQLTVAKLLTTATLLTTSLSARPVAAGPLPPVAAVTQVDDASAAAPPSTATDQGATRSSGPALRDYTTEAGDTWWGIAEETYGSGTRWKEIRNLNLGRTMDDGSVISVATDLLRPSWRLLLPATATTASTTVDLTGADTNGASTDGVGAVAAATASADTITDDEADAADAADDTERPEVVVERGDTLWDLAEDDLDELGRETSSVAVAERVEEIAEINRAALGGDPDLIYPGQRLVLPERPVLAERAPGAVPELPDAPVGGGAGTDTGDEPDGASDDGASEADGGATNDDSTAGDSTADGDAETSGDDDGTDADDPARDDADDSTAMTVVDEEPESASATPATASPESAGRSLDLAPDEPVADDRTDTEAGSPLSPLSPADESAAPLAGARASSPEWVSPATPEATSPETGGLTATPAEPSPTVPAVSGRAIVAPVESRADLTADLPTAGPGDAIDVTVNGLPGDEGLDTADSRAPVFVGLAALTLVGGYLFRARGRRRKTALQNRHPGRRPEPTRRRARPLARRLAAAAEIEHPEFVNLGLRALGRLLNDLPPDELPKVSGLWVSQNRLVLALADDSPRIPPPAPFTPFADGSGWSLLRSHFDEIKAIARGANGPLPLLTTVGTTTSLDLALTTNSRAPAEAYGLASSLLFAVDLEAGRVISVEGRRSEVIETLTMMAIELATSETADQAEIVCVGFGERLATFDRVVSVDDLSGIMPDLEDITSRAVYAAGEASPFATRVGDGAVDTWNPVIVLHADPDDVDAAALVDLADQTEGGVTAVCGYPTERGWRFLVDGDQIHCPDLPGSLSGHRFTRPRAGDIDAIADLFDEGWDEVDLDDEFWAPLDPAADLSVDLLGAGVAAGEPDGLGPDPSWQAMPTTSVSGRRRGAPAGPSAEFDLPPLNLRHSVEQPSTPDGRSAPPPEHTRSTGPDDRDRSPEPELHSGPSIPEQRVDAAPPEFDDRSTPAELDDPTTPPGADEPAPPLAGRHLYVVENPSVRPSDDRPGDGGAGPLSLATIDDDEADEPADAGPAPTEGDPTTTEAPTELRVNVLGQFTIDGHHVGDRTKPWKYTKTAELVLYLLLHPEGASQDLLMEQLFPEQPANRPRLNQLVSDARTKALGVDGNGDYHLPHASPTEPFYRLTTTVGFDLRDFAHHCARARRAESPQVQAMEWTAALELVKGRPFTLPHDGYGWALPEIEATTVKVEEAAVALADLAIDLGDHRLAVWATKKGLLTGTGYYELLVRRGRAALLLEDPEEIVRAFADLQLSLDHTGAPEEGLPDLGAHPDLADVYNELSDGGRGRDRPT